MYKFLVVEDEIEIREGICNYIADAFENLKVYQARNGKIALNIIDREKIDAVFLDIQMPAMNGIELLQELKRKNTNICSVIISGYNEFEYAKEAIECGALKYLLKPVSPAAIHATTEELLKLIDYKRKIENEREQLSEQISQNRELLKNALFLDVIRDRVPLEQFHSKLSYFDLRIEAPFFQVAILDVGAPSSTDLQAQELQKQLLFNFLSTNEDTYSYNVFRIYSDRFVLLFNMEDEDPLKNTTHLITLKDAISEVIESTITFGLGCALRGFPGIQKSYLQAESAINNKVLYGEGDVYCFWETNIKSYNLTIFDSEGFVFALKFALRNQAEQKLTDYFNLLEQEKPNINNMLAVAFLVYFSVASVFADAEKNTAAVHLPELNIHEIIERCKDIHTMQAYLLAITNDCINYQQSVLAETTKNIVKAAVKIIDDNYAQELSSRFIADTLNYNPDYLGRLFKLSMGMSIGSYINKKRISIAKDLLLSTTLPIGEIAEQVGFNDYRYFSATFKKYTGISPSYFRDN